MKYAYAQKKRYRFKVHGVSPEKEIVNGGRDLHVLDNFLRSQGALVKTISCCENLSSCRCESPRQCSLLLKVTFYDSE